MPAMSSQRSARVLLGAVIVSALGDLLFDLYVAWTLTQYLGSVMGAAIVLASSIVFRALLAFLIGGLVDRVSRRVAMVGANLGAILVLFAFMGLYDLATRTVWLALVLVLANDAFNQLFRRAYILSASSMLSTEGFVKFQARASIALRVVATAGMLLAGLAISLFDGRTILWLNIVSFAAAGSLCLLVPDSFRHRVRIATKVHASDVLNDMALVFRRLTTDRYLRVFVVLMVVLNMAYGFVPQLLPLVLADETGSVTDMSWYRAAIAMGEVLGLVLVERFARRVGLLFRISMIGCALSVLAATAGIPSVVVVSAFALYGAFDSLSQPLFSYTVAMIEEDVRGRVLGGIDAVILLSPSLGIFVGSWLSSFSPVLSGAFVFSVFAAGLLIVVSSKFLSNISIPDGTPADTVPFVTPAGD